ncbi:hypothetical protein TWF718_008181 [Orbilia javanica]|uniref:Uncharacterized protein n=1 Tax=Orbilia javanica TaxID=47235 RepID=A0AAN8RMR7_9PEZI
MYSHQLRRGIARGRIWQTSALYQQVVVDGHGVVREQVQRQTRGFTGSRRLLEEEKKGDGDGAAEGGEAPKPRVIPKMNFAELMKKATTLRQSVFKKPPEASASFNPAAPSPPPEASAAPVPAPKATPPPPQTDLPASTGPTIRRTGAEIPTDLISSSAQSSEQIAAERRAARLARHKARLLQETNLEERRKRQEEYEQRRHQQQPLSISDQEAQAQNRAFAEAGAFVKGYTGSRGPTIKRVGSTAHGQPPGAMSFQDRLRMARIARGVSPDLAADRKRQQQQQEAFESDEGGAGVRQMAGGPRITALPVRTGVPLGPRSARAQGPRGATGGRGGGGGGGGRGGAKRTERTRASRASQLEALKKEEEVLDQDWVSMTSNPQRQPEGTIEPHPVYDTTKPYHADVGDLSRWIPAIGAGNTPGARKLQWVGKPKSEKMSEYAPKALLGDGILVPGEVFKATGLGKGNVTKEVEKALSIAEAGVLRNPTFGGKNRVKFLEVLKVKVGVAEDARA